MIVDQVDIVFDDITLAEYEHSYWLIYAEHEVVFASAENLLATLVLSCYSNPLVRRAAMGV